MKIYLRTAAAALPLLFTIFFAGCIRDYSLYDRHNIESAVRLSTDEARAFFESQYSMLCQTRSDISSRPVGITPGHFTPRWDCARENCGGRLASVDIPIIPEYRYKAVRSDFSGGVSSAYEVEVSQKLVVLKKRINNKEHLGQYLLTLIPSKAYYAKNKGDISNKFINCSKKGKFSGIAVYSVPAMNLPVHIYIYENGEAVESINLMDADNVIDVRKFNSVVGHIRFARYSLVLTRNDGEYGGWSGDETLTDWQIDTIIDDCGYGYGNVDVERDDNGWHIHVDTDYDGNIDYSIWVPDGYEPHEDEDDDDYEDEGMKDNNDGETPPEVGGGGGDGNKNVDNGTGGSQNSGVGQEKDISSMANKIIGLFSDTNPLKDLLNSKMENHSIRFLSDPNSKYMMSTYIMIKDGHFVVNRFDIHFVPDILTQASNVGAIMMIFHELFHIYQYSTVTDYSNSMYKSDATIHDNMLNDDKYINAIKEMFPENDNEWYDNIKWSGQQESGGYKRLTPSARNELDKFFEKNGIPY